MIGGLVRIDGGKRERERGGERILGCIVFGHDLWTAFSDLRELLCSRDGCFCRGR